MFDSRQYELLDFGSGRKLERFGAYVLDRPAPAAAEAVPARPELWREFSARFEANAGQKTWTPSRELPATRTVRHGDIVFELKLTEFGHVGMFPEQSALWDWIGERLRDAPASNVLNLFAYTGGSTLAAAAAGAAVTQVDAAANTVAWARRNAELSALAEAPVRWIVEDVRKFAQRELRRGRRYDAVILDPPSYGHGAGGQPWKIEEDLPELLSICRELASPQPRLALLTCHAPGYDPARLAECLKTAGFVGQSESGDLWLSTADGRRLHSGVFARIGR